MSELRAIEVDFDIHKLIENERRSFGEAPNAALRRLLSLPEKAEELADDNGAKASAGRAWSGDGVELPHGTRVQMSYNKRTHTGEIVDGRWLVEGKAYDSPSGAASDVGRTKSGGKTRLDGWNYWLAMKPGETEWAPISGMRPNANLTADELLGKLNLR